MTTVNTNTATTNAATTNAARDESRASNSAVAISPVKIDVGAQPSTANKCVTSVTSAVPRKKLDDDDDDNDKDDEEEESDEDGIDSATHRKSHPVYKSRGKDMDW